MIAEENHLRRFAPPPPAEDRDTSTSSVTALRQAQRPLNLHLLPLSLILASCPPHEGGAGGGFGLLGEQSLQQPPPALRATSASGGQGHFDKLSDRASTSSASFELAPFAFVLDPCIMSPSWRGGAGGGFGLLGEQSLQQPPPALRATSASGGQGHFDKLSDHVTTGPRVRGGQTEGFLKKLPRALLFHSGHAA